MELPEAEWMEQPVDTGTTIIAVTYKGGVILGADTRTTTGSYVSNRSSDKITALADNVYICRSGSAADTQLVSDYVRYFIHQHTAEMGAPATVKTVANLTMTLAYNNKSILSAGMIVAGWDKYEGGTVYGIPIGGTLLKLPFTIGGSGSTYIYGFCDQAWKDDMSLEEAEDFVVKAVALAMARDGSSGGCVRLVVVNEEGATRKFYPGDKLPLFFEEIPPQESLFGPGVTSMAS